MMSNPSGVTETDVEELQSVLAEYPYFQLGYTLIAKAKYDSQAPDAEETLHHAAVYAPSRRLLRKIFYEDLHPIMPVPDSPLENHAPETPLPENKPDPEIEEQPENKPEETPSIEESTTAQETTPEEEKAASDETIYKELEENLKNLRASREQHMEDSSQPDEKAESDKKKMTSEEETGLTQSTWQVAPPQPESKASGNFPYLVDYLKDIEPLQSERLGINQQRQMELIDKFMNSERDVKIRWRLQEQEPQDLSEKGMVSAGNLATENLADIYVRQGKTEKAIQIYHKLILKYPQKKTYFAEKIESLKEN